MKKKILLSLLAATLIWCGYRTEVDFGRVLNNMGDGKLYNGESFYNYIHYPDKAHCNDIVMTVCVLNPFNTYGDDVIWRGDLVLLRDTPYDLDAFPNYEMYQ